MSAKPTLEAIRKTPRGRSYTLKDFITKEEQDRLAEIRSGRTRKPKFDSASSVSAEILARFGYQAWKDWQNGVISDESMSAYLSAERGRDAERLIQLESAILPAIFSLVKKSKNKPAPKGVKYAQQAVNEQTKIMKGLS